MQAFGQYSWMLSLTCRLLCPTLFYFFLCPYKIWSWTQFQFGHFDDFLKRWGTSSNGSFDKSGRGGKFIHVTSRGGIGVRNVSSCYVGLCYRFALFVLDRVRPIYLFSDSKSSHMCVSIMVPHMLSCSMDNTLTRYLKLFYLWTLHTSLCASELSRFALTYCPCLWEMATKRGWSVLRVSYRKAFSTPQSAT